MSPHMSKSYTPLLSTFAYSTASDQRREVGTAWKQGYTKTIYAKVYTLRKSLSLWISLISFSSVFRWYNSVYLASWVLLELSHICQHLPQLSTRLLGCWRDPCWPLLRKQFPVEREAAQSGRGRGGGLWPLHLLWRFLLALSWLEWWVYVLSLKWCAN